MQKDILVLHSDNSHNIFWHLNASFGFHNDKKNHISSNMTLGGGSITSVSTKHEINIHSTTKAEVVSIDDMISKVLWTKQFLQEQGYVANTNIMMRDNTSSIKLENNDKTSSGERTGQHFDIKYLHLTDFIARN